VLFGRGPAAEAGAFPVGVGRTVVILAIVFVAGTAGYVQIEGLSVLDAVYLTSIILSTVGLAYSETAGLSPAGRLFAVFLIWGGVSTVAFLDMVVQPGQEALRLEAVEIPGPSRWAGRTLADVRIPQRTNLLVMGVKRGGAAGTFVFNPSARERLDAGDSLVVLGTPEQRERLAALLAETEGPATTPPA
jgi:hypothetical protein